jgi:molecular chaperone DnaK
VRDPIVGIDLGTSNTVVASADGTANVQVLADESGKIHPSVVSFHPNGGVVVGAPAKQRKVIDPKNTIFSVKRLIGRSFDSKEVQTARQRMPYQIKEGQNRLPMIVTRGGEFAVPEVSAIVLDHVKTVASAQLQTDVSRAVITVPASFNDAQRSATATAGAIAGLTVVRVLNEPTAAALAYGHQRDMREVIAVYDFGGGTFDITILKLSDNIYEVLGTAGDSFLGGDDLDERLVDRMVEKFLAETRVDLRSNEVSMMRLRAVAEQTKIELSRRARAVVRVDEIAYGPQGRPLDLQVEITRDEFVRQVADIVDRTFPVCQEALALAGIAVEQVEDVVLVGGTTKIPYVRDQVTKFFAKAPRTDANPEEAVAAGAALQAVALERILRPRGATTSAATDFKTEEVTTRGADSDDSSITLPSGTSPSPPPLVDDTNELTLLPPVAQPTRPNADDARKRSTQPYAATAVREERTPRVKIPERTQPIGRVANSAPSPLSRTVIGVPDAPAPPPTTPPLRPPTRPPPLPPAAQRPTLIVPPAPAPPPPVAPPSAPTLVLDDIDVGAASTARGIAPFRLPSAPVPPPIAFDAPSAPAPLVLDVTPRGLGIATVAGFCEELIRRNSRVPTEKRKLFTTSRDQQDTVRIVVVQGESRRMDQNVVIGDLTLADLPRRPRGETSIEVTFLLDASGILQVSARDAQSGREQRASLDIVGTLPEAHVAASRDRVHALRR